MRNVLFQQPSWALGNWRPGKTGGLGGNDQAPSSAPPSKIDKSNEELCNQVIFQMVPKFDSMDDLMNTVDTSDKRGSGLLDEPASSQPDSTKHENKSMRMIISRADRSGSHKSPSSAHRSPSVANKSPAKSPSVANKSPATASKSPKVANKSPKFGNKTPKIANKSPGNATRKRGRPRTQNGTPISPVKEQAIKNAFKTKDVGRQNSRTKGKTPPQSEAPSSTVPKNTKLKNSPKSREFLSSSSSSSSGSESSGSSCENSDSEEEPPEKPKFPVQAKKPGRPPLVNKAPSNNSSWSENLVSKDKVDIELAPPLPMLSPIHSHTVANIASAVSPLGDSNHKLSQLGVTHDQQGKPCIMVRFDLSRLDLNHSADSPRTKPPKSGSPAPNLVKRSPAPNIKTSPAPVRKSSPAPNVIKGSPAHTVKSSLAPEIRSPPVPDLLSEIKKERDEISSSPATSADGDTCSPINSPAPLIDEKPESQTQKSGAKERDILSKIFPKDNAKASEMKKIPKRKPPNDSHSQENSKRPRKDDQSSSKPTADVTDKE